MPFVEIAFGQSLRRLSWQMMILAQIANQTKTPIRGQLEISALHIETTPLDGVVILTPVRFGDHRGFFSESWNKARLAAAGLNLPEFVQDNHSLSVQANTVRGLHFQAPPHAQGKMVRCGRGRLFDVAVDIRLGSPTYGQWTGIELSFENARQLWIPAGFLHGFMTLEPDTEIVYKCTDYYVPECDGAVHWDSCGVHWPLKGARPIISSKDEAAPASAGFETPFTYQEHRS